MKLKTILSALAIAAIPMAAQAGQASALTMQLSEPLSTSSQAISQGNEAYSPVVDVSGAIENNGDSTAMAKVRATLNAKNHHVSVKEVAGDSLKPARDATT
ncbi:hypothetical protein [Halomonas salina]|uniref:DUF1471 domain-containing protein n=1 Tax=Halomonas salina TaxID=42565 RepID=A0ABR4WQ02_9GAMM|nr:hypothetical protein [Halomonas salina]KGE76792.1 hypothetical protein FP66_14505 [Halomonas salina]